MVVGVFSSVTRSVFDSGAASGACASGGTMGSTSAAGWMITIGAGRASDDVRPVLALRRRGRWIPASFLRYWAIGIFETKNIPTVISVVLVLVVLVSL